MMVNNFVVLVQVLGLGYVYCSEGYENKIDEYVISCHSTDFACFQTQYQYLRDHILLGCQELEVPVYQPYHFQYADTNTCVKISGVEASKLVGMSFDGTNKLFSVMVHMPVRFQQVAPTWTAPCQRPEKEFTSRGPQEGPFKKFAGNATMVVQFPFQLVKMKELQYMVIEDEELDVTLDVPDLSSYNKSSIWESRLYESSEWAYEMVQHVDVPEHVMVPYLHQMKAVYGKLPLKKLIVLYPTEKYEDLRFKYVKDIPL